MRATFVRAFALVVVTIAAAFTFGGQSELASAGGGACHQAPAREGAGTEVRLTRNCFSPSILRVEAGADVTFHNDDQVLHQLSSIPGQQPGDSEVAVGQVATRTFMDPGIYPYFCNLHFGMVGAIVVGDGKFVASSGNRAVAVQAAQPQVQKASPGERPASAIAAAVGDEGDDASRWPLAAGVAIAAAGLLGGIGIATRQRWYR